MSDSETASPSTLRPWQFFTLLALCSATAAVFILRGTSAPNLVLVCVAIGAAALAALAVLRTLRPLVSPNAIEVEMVGSRTRVALEREKNLLLRSLKELEFDRAMGKLAEADYDEMAQRLRARALRLMKQLEADGSGYRELIERELASRLGRAGSTARVAESAEEEEEEEEEKEPAGVARFCQGCGAARDVDARFCKHCGVKLLVFLLAVLTFASPVWAQPDPRQMSGIPRPVTDLPERTISVRLIRGQLTNNITNHPVEVHYGDRVLTVKTDQEGRAEFSGVMPGTLVKAVAIVDGERLESEEFPWPGQGGIRLLLVASEKPGEAAEAAEGRREVPSQPGTVSLGRETHVVLAPAEESIQIYYILAVSNTANAPVSPASPVILDLPGGAQGAAVLGGASQQAIARGTRITIAGPFKAGQTVFEVSYQLPYSGGSVSVPQTFPVALSDVSVLMKKLGAMSMSSPQFSAQQERQYEGATYVVAQGAGLPPGGALTIQVAGLPHHSGVPRTVALALACVMIGAGGFAATRRMPRADGGHVKQLKGRRDRIFADLVRLEEQRRSGATDAARYADRRETLVSQLERIYRELDAEGGEDLAA